MKEVDLLDPVVEASVNEGAEVFFHHTVHPQLVTHLLPGLVPSEVSLIASLRFMYDHLDGFTGGVIWRQFWRFRSRSPVCLSGLCSSENPKEFEGEVRMMTCVMPNLL